jgi:predicted nucleic acid-binding protein
MFLVDANVLSEPTKPQPSARVVDWLRVNEGQLAVNPIVLGELEYGILLLPSGRRRERLLEWFSVGVRRLKVVAFDAVTATEWATLLAELKHAGLAMPIKDSLIAASARQHQLTVATRNVSDYSSAEVVIVNPFADA